MDDEETLTGKKSQEEEGRLSGDQKISESALSEKQKEIDRFVNEDIYFKYDSAVIMPDAQMILKQKAEWLNNNKQFRVIIEGHCDERGTNEYNLALGDRRAQAVKTFISDLGVPVQRLRTISYGEERPAALGHEEPAWSRNRRCHFAIE
jgi:peptidoglycan-associated lipoprotein